MNIWNKQRVTGDMYLHFFNLNLKLLFCMKLHVITTQLLTRTYHINNGRYEFKYDTYGKHTYQ